MNILTLRDEKKYALLFIIIACITGFLSSMWLLSFLLCSLIYIIWKWIEFYSFYQWYKNGAKKSEVPFNHGFFRNLSKHIVNNKNKQHKIVKNNKLLINQFNRMAEALPYAVIILNKNCEIIWVNSIAHDILGVKQEDKGNNILSIIKGSKLNEMLRQKSKTSDFKMSCPQNTPKTIHINLVKISNNRFLMVARDISKQESLRESRKAFFANASHELRTPLTVIIGYLEMLYSAKDIPQKWHSAIESVTLQSNRMEKIINDMLKLSRIEHERFLENKEENINMPKLLNNLLNEIKNSTHAKNHVFEANIDSSLNLRGKHEEMTSVILNLLNNAVIHTGPNTKVKIKWYYKNNKANLSICDTGEGIDSKHLKHLTQRFYRIDNSECQNFNSTGLGLAIVKQICDNYMASITIDSELGKGTCFKLEFPSSRTLI